MTSLYAVLRKVGSRSFQNQIKIGKCALIGRMAKFSTTVSKDLIPPDEFYDHDKEEASEFADLTTAISRGGINKLTLLETTNGDETIDSDYRLRDLTDEQVASLWRQIERNAAEKKFACDERKFADFIAKLRNGEPLSQPDYNFKHQVKEMLLMNDYSEDEFDGEYDENEDEDAVGQEEAERMLTAVANEDLEDPGPNDAEFAPTEMLNMNIPWRKTEEFPDKLLDKFMPKTSPEKFNYNQQGFRHCPGKLQRKGMNPQLNCHILDVDELHFLDVLTLRRFISDDSEILPRKATGLCAKCQRKVAKTVKRSRHFGLLPHIGQYVIADGRPHHQEEHLHDALPDQVHVQSTSIL